MHCKQKRIPSEWSTVIIKPIFIHEKTEVIVKVIWALAF